MSQFASKYSIELVNPSGLLLADLSGRAKARRLVKSRNEADEIDWTLDLNEFEKYCRDSNQDPATILKLGSTEVRIKRLGKYLGGGQLEYSEPNITAANQTINIRASGFLNLLKDRYTSSERNFTATEATTIAWTVIAESQALTNGDFGITQGVVATAGPHNRTYKYVDLKTILQNLTKVQTNPFDFEFTYNKVFNTYTSIGSNRPDIIFEYPNNIIAINVPNDATGLANEVIALGAGIGIDAGTVVVADNTSSQLDLKLRQKIINVNGTDDSDGGVTDAAGAELSAWAYPYELPALTVNGNVAPYITDYNIGDRIQIKINNYALLNHINGLYRLERYQLDIDDDDNETIQLQVSI